MEPSYDLIILGTGAAGTSAATRARHLGARRVAVVERGPLWGTCVNTGCIPSKLLLAVGELAFYRNHGHPGLGMEATLDPGQLLGEKRELVLRLRDRKARRIFGELGVELVEGAARFISPREIEVGGRRMEASRFVIATGSSPSVPPVEGLAGVPYLTNIEALDLGEVPESLIVVGGRALGLEFAQAFAHLGSAVTLLQRSPRILPGEEPEISTLMEDCLRAEGIAVHTGADLVRVRKETGGIGVTARVKGAAEKFTAARLLLATGRVPNTRDLDLAACGVKVDGKGAVMVDDMMQTSAPGILAAGDVTGEPMLEPWAGVGGAVAAENALTGKGRRIDRSALPHAVFTTPQVAGVGLTEALARAQGIAVKARSVSLEGLARAMIHGDTRGLVKMVAGERTGKILGVHICAPHAAEVIMEGVLAVKAGLTTEDLVDTFHVFPTMAGAIQDCARAFRH
jgi:mercuric reductase